MGEAVITLLRGLPWTIALTVAAFSIGTVLGIPLCALRLSRHVALRLLASSIVVTFRSIPPLVWLFVIYFGIGSGYLNIGPFQAAITGLGLITAANMSEIYRGSVAAIHQGQFEAAAALNLPARSRFFDVLCPQIFRVALPASATFAIGLLKDSAIASTIGVLEITFQAYHLAQQTYRGLEDFALAGLIYILISLPIAILARRTDTLLRSKVAR